MLFVGLKFLYTKAASDDLLLLLSPVNFFVGLFTGQTSFYELEIGYIYSGLNISITKECSGFQFWVLSFLIFSISTQTLLRKSGVKLLSILLIFFLTYLITLIANTSRIICSIYFMTPLTWINLSSIQIHEILGVIIHLLFLVAFYLLFQSIKTKIFNEEST